VKLLRVDLISAVVTVLVAAPAAAQDLAGARARHERGVALFNEQPPNYNGALTEFEEAYRLSAGHPRRYIELRNIAECYQNLGQYDRAITYLQRYLQEGGPGAEDRPRYEAALSVLESTMGTVEVTTNVPAAEVWADNRRVGDAPGRVRVPGGRHVIELRAVGRSPARREVDVVSRQSARVHMDLDALGRGGITPAVFWIGLGATAVVAGVGGVFGVQAMSARGDVDTRLASSDAAVRFTVSPADRQRIAELAQVADILYLSAGVLAVGTTVVAFLTDFRGASGEQPRATLRVAPLLGPLVQGLSLEGRF
jgi:hypothetical protein